MDDLDLSADLTSTTKHERVIIHIDVDCFYAQVEELKNPNLKGQPIGVQQKNIVVTSNYVARKFGIKKCMSVSEALQLCPDLVLVCGEDLHDYRKMSANITSVLQKFNPLVEKLGFDENFIDVTQIVNDRLTSDCENVPLQGHVYESNPTECACGCHLRLCIGSQIACEMRLEIYKVLNVTTCAGISYNKLLAKLVSSVHKPNQQTTLFPSGMNSLILNLDSVRNLPGIGYSMSRLLMTQNITTIPELKNAPLSSLQHILGQETAIRFKKLSFGIDDSPVKPSGKPFSLGIEDGFRKISLESEVRDKFCILLQRLMTLLAEDGRVPRSIKVTVRKYDTKTKQSHKESRQSNAVPFFSSVEKPTRGNLHSILESVMQLFHKTVDISKPFHLTLLGVSFSKFVNRALGKGSISSFLQKDVSVQTITNIKNTSCTDTSKEECLPSTSGLRTPTSRLSSNNSGSESDVEPSPKKMRKELWTNKRKRLSVDLDEDSPSKLRVSELRLSSPVTSRRSQELSLSELRLSPAHSPVPDQQIKFLKSPDEGKASSVPLNCPEDVDPEVFRELPSDVQQELLSDWKLNKESSAKVAICKPKSCILNTNVGKKRSIVTLHKYFAVSPKK